MFTAVNALLQQELKESLTRIQRSSQLLENYTCQVRKKHHIFEKIEGLKFFLFSICCISSPIITIIILLEKLHITDWF